MGAPRILLCLSGSAGSMGVMIVFGVTGVDTPLSSAVLKFLPM